MISENLGRTKNGDTVTRYTIGDEKSGMLSVLDKGAVIQRLLVPCGGRLIDVVLGHDSAAEYEQEPLFYLGCVVGRCAGRIGGAAFELDGQNYPLSPGPSGSTLHGGPGGFHQKMFRLTEHTPRSLTLETISPDGEEGFPGEVRLSVRYEWNENTLSIHYKGTSDKPTLLNPTNHSYFNLAGHGSVLGHTLQLAAERYMPGDGACLATGEVAPVQGTPMDFTAEKPIGEEISAPFEQLRLAGGYDHYYFLEGEGGTLRRVGTLACPESRLAMTCYTTAPGAVIYTGNSLLPRPGKNGEMCQRHGAVCIECQFPPDAIHHPQLPSPILRPKEVFRSVTRYVFKSF